MLTVYCQKLENTWFTPEMYGFVGVIIGALISGGIAFLISNSNIKNTYKLESKRITAKVFTDFFLKEVIFYIDSEVSYLQKLYLDQSKEDLEVTPAHQENMTSVDSSIRMFKDELLIEQYVNFNKQCTKIQDAIVNDKQDEALTELVAARGYAADLKLSLLKKCDF